MDERLRFVARVLEGEQIAPLCREFGISRVTGYKIWLVSFINYDLGFFDRENDRVEPSPNPFAPEKV